MEAKDLPQGSASGGNQLNFDWDMSQPLVLPAPHGDLLDLAMTPEDSSADTSMHKEHETQSTASPKLVPVEDSTEASELNPRLTTLSL